ncbi:exopolysaccharide biosynthesis polyprenyl glycosylphosphotransferase [Carboxydocella sporoproducens DSM 16521]|uniref:Exopolysaccharide biosynthesis polyprenyl glycosylphosphotransferase n=2 Tax=Carboxydocella TaxID=178898 RepID=A0A1T4P1T2_9FIRM|nr:MULTISPECIES: exopolysaccharide biosynthesis polyprenyl glycosylphosphotransferase [Carboxydocella]AVX19584.1 exopolysaccharide biosynthesis polyprenyl glycosylphosphotransferase [Carboxydocella thermautotrophica]AVX29999.1 exopolysaccharide biosynthesis polyprenyl glycosylphosphotransferase [Carboxydocella thermautotrophica]SJZ85362.1 exopolysaccharide biosynthesis polyprenyl glycosylphosphotransferase [Carboxydocella sporoproducens DSM 16521]
MAILIIPVSYLLAFYLRFSGAYEQANLESLLTSLPWLTLWGFLLLYIYDFLPYRRLDREERLASIILVVALQLLGGMALSFFLRSFAFPRTVFLLASIFQLLGLWLSSHYRDQQLKSNFNDIICLPSHLTPTEQAIMILSAWQEGKNVELIPTLEQLLVLGGKLERSGTELRIILRPQVRMQGLKRLLDLIISLPLLLLLLPLFIIISILVKIDSPGPILYRQQRVTIGGKIFWLYKFRTMQVDAEAVTGPVLATKNDPRITRIGKLLRRTRLDELPQLWNVFKGEMSLVGPRPERPEFVTIYQQKIPGYELRHLMRAGLTGLAQVSAGYDLPVEEKLKYDLAYINSWSIWEDIKILFRTLRTIFLLNRAH